MITTGIAVRGRNDCNDSDLSMGEFIVTEVNEKTQMLTLQCTHHADEDLIGETMYALPDQVERLDGEPIIGGIVSAPTEPLKIKPLTTQQALILGIY